MRQRVQDDEVDDGGQSNFLVSDSILGKLL